MRVFRYQESQKEEWNFFVKSSRNATFLFERDFMDYHKDRFIDCSLFVLSEKGKLLGLFPATIDTAKKHVVSHGGLTYGGLLLRHDVGTSQVMEMLVAIVSFYQEMKMSFLYIKPIPHIYHLCPAEEELYALFRIGAQLSARGVSSTVDLGVPLTFSTLRKRKYKAAQSSDLKINIKGDILIFWELLTETLNKTHGVAPVHSYEEISRLAESFPEEIQCVTVTDFENKIIAGTLLFLTPRVVHAQYIAASGRGKELGALDFLFINLLSSFQYRYQHDLTPRYFDFGISTENKGHYLNEGLIFQKEGFGAHATLYDEYVVNLSSNESSFSRSPKAQ